MMVTTRRRSYTRNTRGISSALPAFWGLALVETDSNTIRFLYGKIRVVGVCYGCELWMGAMDSFSSIDTSRFKV
uniref:SFRICE_028891 n=1 Tax=Spodoptera frugiperda TaxID=7108 RepID=A0A2H1X1A2_SPOFR